MLTYEQILEEGVYLIPNPKRFCHLTISLVEGLTALGIPCFSEYNYWKSTPKSSFLLRNDPDVFPQNCAICILDLFADSLDEINTRIEKTADCKNLRVVLHDADGEFGGKWAEQFDYVFRTHMSKVFDYPDNFIPWGFGVSNRIQQFTASNLDYDSRESKVLLNFRPTGNQCVRVLFDLTLAPILSEYFELDRMIDAPEQTVQDLDEIDYNYHQQTQGRHNSAYYQRLGTAQVSAAYGGTFAYGSSLEPNSIKSSPGIRRWDSWRFWESLMSRCVTLHLDFQKYGFLLPVVPENWKHYIGLNLDNLKNDIERMNDEPELLAQIANDGQRWAWENYGPIPTACRFLDIVLQEEMGTTHALITMLNGLSE